MLKMPPKYAVKTRADDLVSPHCGDTPRVCVLVTALLFVRFCCDLHSLGTNEKSSKWAGPVGCFVLLCCVLFSLTCKGQASAMGKAPALQLDSKDSKADLMLRAF